MIVALEISLAAILVLLRAGYLWGVRVGLLERDRLSAQLEQLVAETPKADAAEEAEPGGMQSMIEQMLRPLVERERISRDLAKFTISQGERRDLTRLLDRVASVGHFETMLLSNEEGLPLASNSIAGNSERLAASMARVALVMDQAGDRDGPLPTAFLLRDSADVMTLCRIFHVNGQRLLLTARSKDLRLTTADLDAAASKVEAALSINAACYDELSGSMRASA